jgi:hypothetical protein
MQPAEPAAPSRERFIDYSDNLCAVCQWALSHGLVIHSLRTQQALRGLRSSVSQCSPVDSSKTSAPIGRGMLDIVTYRNRLRNNVFS